MGMHVGLIAAKTSVTRLRDAFTRVWPRFEQVASAEHLADEAAMEAWKESHEQFVSAADWTKDDPGKEVFAFWQDGPWALLMDNSYVLAADEEGLKVLSAHLGTVISFVVETAGGCAAFWCFENGQPRRSVSNADASVTRTGEPLPEEAGIDMTNYYMDETEALWKAFGLSPFEADEGYQAICVVDRTDYGRVLGSRPATPLPRESANEALAPLAQPRWPQKPWWRFW